MLGLCARHIDFNIEREEEEAPLKDGAFLRELRELDLVCRATKHGEPRGKDGGGGAFTSREGCRTAGVPSVSQARELEPSPPVFSRLRPTRRCSPSRGTGCSRCSGWSTPS